MPTHPPYFDTLPAKIAIHRQTFPHSQCFALILSHEKKPMPNAGRSRQPKWDEKDLRHIRYTGADLRDVDGTGQHGQPLAGLAQRQPARHHPFGCLAAVGIQLRQQRPRFRTGYCGGAVGVCPKKELPRWQGRALNTIGLSHRFQSNFAAALQRYEQSIVLLEQAGDGKNLSAVYGNMGDVYRLQSNFPKAIDCLTKCLKLAEEAGDPKKPPMLTSASPPFSTTTPATTKRPWNTSKRQGSFTRN
ncbi:MAG: tetratricopeptide repeat protein [Saprospiraceae bacterium]|nr:tetratricopeptide repeat protein [Saprospiraceae bacterium]